MSEIDSEDFREPCPQCGSREIGGLMAAFYLPVQVDGSPKYPERQSWQAETEMGPERLCYVCGHKWGEEQPE